MAKNGFLLRYLLSVLMLSLSLLCDGYNGDRKVHIVYMGSLPDREYSPSSHHLTMLQDVVDESSSAENLLIRSYKRSFNGFAARITDDEREKLASREGVVSVFPSRMYKLQTTRSWDFMGFNESVKHEASAESDIIIGVIDTGVWPESESFNDPGLGPPPKKWKGACVGGKNFTCNNKLIGARYYNSSGAEIDSTRDFDGHGTHTASTAAGNKVKGASFYGLAQGTARGGVPSARIAAYNICDEHDCPSENVLAAFDDAIADGVDILSVSLGLQNPAPFEYEPVSIGAFHAMQKGILTVQAAGNTISTYINGSVSAISPWILSVAASTTDRFFIDKVVLGNGKTLVGVSINAFSLGGVKYPLIFGENITRSSKCTKDLTESCSIDCVDSDLVKGKIVLCDWFYGNFLVERAKSAVGSITKRDHDNYTAQIPILPTSDLSPDDFDNVITYVSTTEKPVAEILKSETIESSDAPLVAFFSARGPNLIVHDVLKPDLTAPGVDILAAYSPLGSPARDPTDHRHVKYSILTGTSMSCPHAAGAAAYVKSFHPDWSPSAIMSALMTTAWSMNSSKNPYGEFSYGSGHINPVKAIDPGLVYDVANKGDYIELLCGMGYNGSKLRQITGDNSTCLKGGEKFLARDLNYPSMALRVHKRQEFNVTFHRTVTNVGPENSTYRLNVTPDPKSRIEVMPEILTFKSRNEKKSYQVTVAGKLMEFSERASASLVWSDGIHNVRSPVVVYTPEFE